MVHGYTKVCRDTVSLLKQPCINGLVSLLACERYGAETVSVACRRRFSKSLKYGRHAVRDKKEDAVETSIIASATAVEKQANIAFAINSLFRLPCAIFTLPRLRSAADHLDFCAEY